MNDLPAGYVHLGHAAIHVATPRRFTTDVDRFRRMLPIVQELEQLGAGSDAWRTRLGKLDDATLEAVGLTLDELGRVNQHLAEQLQRHREGSREELAVIVVGEPDNGFRISRRRPPKPHRTGDSRVAGARPGATPGKMRLSGRFTENPGFPWPR